MGYEDNEQEIDLIAMLFDALYKWRSILLAGLIGALLLGAYKYWNVNKASVTLEKAIADGTVSESDFDQAYLTAKQNIEDKEKERRTQSQASTDVQGKINGVNNTITDSRADIEVQENNIKLYNAQIENAQRLVDEIQGYLDQSVLMQAAEELWTGKAVYQVNVADADPNSYRDPADQLVSSYQKPMAGSDEMAALAEKYGLDSILLDELFSVESNIDANNVIITANGRDKAMAEEILGKVCNLVEVQAREMGIPHALEKTRQEFSKEKNAELVETRNTKKDKIVSYQGTMNTAKASIVTANAKIEKDEREIANAEAKISDLESEKELSDEKVGLLEKEITTLKENMPPKVSGSAPKVKSSIKWAVIGFVAGCAVLFMVYVALYVLRPRLRRPDDIRTGYGYPVIGVLNKKGREKSCIVDQWIMKAEGRGKRPGDDEIIRTAAVTIANTAQEGSRIALLSSLKSGKTLDILSEQISGLVPSMSFVTLTEGVTKAANVDELSRCDAVVLVEERNETTMDKLDADINQARLFNKKVLGAIVL